MKKYIFLVMVLIPSAAHSANTVNEINRLLFFLNQFRQMDANPLVLQTVVNNQHVEIIGTDVLRAVYDENINTAHNTPQEMQALNNAVHRQNATPAEIFTETDRAIQALTNKLPNQNL